MYLAKIKLQSYKKNIQQTKNNTYAQMHFKNL